MREMGLIESMFFYTGPAIVTVFRIGFVPRRAEFRKMTEEERCLFAVEMPDKAKEEYWVVRNRDKFGDKNALVIFKEEEIDQLMSAVKHLDRLVMGETFEDDEKMLHRVAQCLPPVFTKDTRFARKDF